MKFTTYLKDKNVALLVCFSGGLLFTVMLLFFGLGAGEVVLLWLCYLLILAGFFCFDYWTQRRRLKALLSVMQTLDKKYLFAEVVDKPYSELERAYFRLVKTALKSMIDEVSKTNRLSLEYREYIEQWVHEIKVPITGIKLMCENNKNEDMRKIMSQA
jgi:signal transduction histidine kinase